MNVVYSKNELFYEEPVILPEQEFEIDGIKVHFSYTTPTLPHFDFYGDISKTGYRSDFVENEWLDKFGVESLAQERIKIIRADFYKKQNRKKRDYKYDIG